MSVSLSLKASEESTYIVIASFFDEEGSSITPNFVTWRLSLSNGVIVNNRDAEIETPASEVNIILKGDDLGIMSGAKSDVRVVTIWGTYNSSYGNNLPYSSEVLFTISNLKGIS